MGTHRPSTGMGTEGLHPPPPQACLAPPHPRRECPAIEKTSSLKASGQRPHEAAVALFGSGDATARWSSSWWWATSPQLVDRPRGGHLPRGTSSHTATTTLGNP